MERNAAVRGSTEEEEEEEDVESDEFSLKSSQVDDSCPDVECRLSKAINQFLNWALVTYRRNDALAQTTNR